MILALSDDCPIFRDEAKPHLLNLLYTMAHRRRHLLAAPTPSRLRELISDDVWMLYGTYLVQSAKLVINSSQTWIASADCSGCDAQNLARFCELPTVVVVENAQTDGNWLKMVIHKLRPRLANVLGYPALALDIRTGGGVGEIPKELERIGNQYERVRPNASMPLKVIAFADSDAKLPGEMSHSAREVIDAAQNIGAKAHILKKRSIENYIPDDSLYQYVAIRRDRAAVVDLVAALGSPARDHYPLKGGLTEEELAITGTMYPSNVPLGAGLGDFMMDFISKFGHNIDKNELRKRDGAQELDSLMDLLEENI